MTETDANSKRKGNKKYDHVCVWLFGYHNNFKSRGHQNFCERFMNSYLKFRYQRPFSPSLSLLRVSQRRVKALNCYVQWCHSAFRKYFSKLFWLKLSDATNIKECPCNSACLELEYEPRVSYSKFPDTSIIKLMQKAFNANVSASYMQ